MVCGGAKAEYIVDVWSGNHPFYQGNKNTIVLDDGRVSRFNKQYADLASTFGNVETANGPDAAVMTKTGTLWRAFARRKHTLSLAPSRCRAQAGTSTQEEVSGSAAFCSRVWRDQSL